MDWEKQYLDNHTPWDKGAPAPPLLEWMDHNPNALSGKVLVPGCGLGHDSRSLAEISTVEAIVGLDISAKAVERANRIPKVGVETYEVGDLFALENRHLQNYDWIWEHTCFCAIDPKLRDHYVEATWALLKPGATLLGVFFLDPYDEEHCPGGGPPHGTSIEELRERFEGSGRFREVESYSPNRSYEGREGLEQVIRYERIE